MTSLKLVKMMRSSDLLKSFAKIEIKNKIDLNKRKRNFKSSALFLKRNYKFNECDILSKLKIHVDVSSLSKLRNLIYTFQWPSASFCSSLIFFSGLDCHINRSSSRWFESLEPLDSWSNLTPFRLGMSALRSNLSPAAPIITNSINFTNPTHSSIDGCASNAVSGYCFVCWHTKARYM